ncbi:MAG: DUF1698 domain-containing protein [Kiritimatiellae bacterium]|nr:DUF1698 domain-containing protein [Kiritimatiellia bacterium]
MHESLRQRIEKHVWYHEFDFGNGVITKARQPYRDLWLATERFLDKIDFHGKRVLDIGCWDGYWSFYAERRGAASVLATDLNSQRWVDEGGTLRSASASDNEGFRIAQEIYGSQVEYRGDVSAYDLTRLGRTFDIVFFLGVYYHLTHVMYAFTQIRHVLAPNGEVIVEGGVVDDGDRSFMEFYCGYDGPEPYRKDPSNWVCPSRRCLKDMISANYLEAVDEFYVPHPVGEGQRWKTRLSRLAARILSIPVEQPTRYGRMLVRAKAVERRNDCYFYEPLFGLNRYDPRFRQG